MMTRETVQLNYWDAASIALIQLNRPTALNALNPQLADDFSSVIDELEGRPEVRAVIVTGNGKAFCAGGDLAAFKALLDAGESIGKLAAKFHDSILKIRNMDAPFIAAINGPCFGVGLSLACACDLRLALENATFSVAFTGVGLSPDSGLPWFLPHIVGLGVATELALLNPIFDVKRAKEINLLTAMSASDVVADALELARQLALMPTKALGMVKRLYNDCYADTLTQHLDKQAVGVGETSLTEDFQEGCAAFFEKRKPLFKGR
jgi:2-(1,2-epoxy-1,2-dihydrophenyl)acetyl-CoA isomerase